MNNELNTLKDEITSEIKKAIVETIHGNPTFIDTKQLKERFNIRSNTTVQSLIKRGLPYRRFTARGKLYYNLHDVENYLNKEK